MQGNGPLAATAPPERGLAHDGLPRSLDIEIDPPVQWDSKTFDHLHLEEPTARMVLRAEGELSGTVNMPQMRAYQIALVSHAAGVPRQVIEQMRISQMLEAFGFLAHFI